MGDAGSQAVILVLHHPVIKYVEEVILGSVLGISYGLMLQF